MTFIEDLGMKPNKSGNSFRVWLCKCEECGKIVEAYAHNIKKNPDSLCHSCTLIARNTTHGKSHTKAYEVWRNMMARCYRETNRQYKDWGGRGIVVCEEWHDFETFELWFNKEFKENCQIDRINNDGNYEPSNCHFITRSENLSNKRCKENKRSKYRYVLWHGQSGGWRVTFKGRYIGYHKDEEEAYKLLCADSDYIIYKGNLT